MSPPDFSDKTTALCEPEQIASEWLIGELPARLIPHYLLEQLSTTLTALLPFQSGPTHCHAKD